MSTISSTINNTAMIYKMALANGGSLFGGGSAGLMGSVGSGKQDSSVSSMWQSYSNSAASAASAVSGLSEIRSSRAELVSSYDAAAKTFKAELGSAVKDLSDSLGAMKKLDYHVGGEDAITKKTTTTEEGESVTTTVYSKDMENVLSTVEDFVDSYNAATKLFNDYGDVSKKMTQLSSIFSDATARADTYEQIGLNVASDGTISIDKEKLAKAINESPERVSGILGRDGLTGKAEDHLQYVRGQEDRLFPSINSMFGDQLKQATVYTGNAMSQMSGYAMVGNLFNMMF